MLKIPSFISLLCNKRFGVLVFALSGLLPYNGNCQTEKGSSQLQKITTKEETKVDTGITRFIADTVVPEIKVDIHQLYDAQNKIDSLQKYIANIESKLSDMHVKCLNLADTLKKYRLFTEGLHGISGCVAKTVYFKDGYYDCYIADTRTAKISLFWNTFGDKIPVRTISGLNEALKRQGKTLVFASNAGMFEYDYSPKGLYIENGKILSPVDTISKGYGNFYLQPNGIFYVDSAGQSGILSTVNFQSQKLKNIQLATQSGPMLLKDGIINDKFTPGSNNLNIRNGVGIIDSNHVVFVISNQRVNFYDFASLFKDEFGCTNALYLDGAISDSFIPGLARPEDGRSLGPIFGIIKN